MTEYGTIRTEVIDGSISRITLNRPEARNAQNRRMLYELNDAFTGAAFDDGIKVVILAGEGPHFSSGHDTRDREEFDAAPVGIAGGFAQPGAEGHMAREDEIYFNMCRRWQQLPKPTIAQVHGKIIAGGLMLMWVCDVIIAAEGSQFIDLTVGMGVNGVEWFAHPWELGMRKAKEMLFTGDPVSADEAYNLGMVNHVVPPDELGEFTLEVARKIAVRPSFSLKLAKASCNQTLDAQGFWTAQQAAFSLQQLGHSHARELFGKPVIPAAAPPAVEQSAPLASGASGSPGAAALAKGMEPDHLARYLEHRMPGAKVEVREAHQAWPGMSRETWFIQTTIRDGDGERNEGFAFRRDPPGGGVVPTPLRREWEVYLRLADTAVPVARALWWEEDPEWALDDRPFFVRRIVEGRSTIAGIYDAGAAGDQLRESVAKEHAEKLAILHTVEWKKHGFGDVLDAPNTPDDGPGLEFETWRRIWDDVRVEPFPLVTKALKWFEKNLPTTAPRVCLLKGNNGLGEEIWRDGSIVAMSDWELASLGDPSQDWGFSQGMLELWDSELILRHYEARVGFELPRRNVEYWRAWTKFKSLVCVQAGLRAFCDGRDHRAALATMGLGAARLLLARMATIVELDLDGAARVLAESDRRPRVAASGRAT